MFRHLAEDIAFLLITRKIVKIEERDIYVYGLEVLLLNGSLLLLYLLISWLSGTMINFLAYMMFFFPLRIFSGGYHASTSEKCFVASTIMYIISVVIVKLLPDLYQDCYWTFTLIISVIIILIFAPLVNVNNPLNEFQRKRNRIIVLFLILLDLGLFILFSRFSIAMATNEMIFIIFDAILLIIGKMAQYMYNDENQ